MESNLKEKQRYHVSVMFISQVKRSVSAALFALAAWGTDPRSSDAIEPPDTTTQSLIPTVDLSDLCDAALLIEYEEAGLAIKETGYEPRDGGPPAPPPPRSPLLDRFSKVKAEIVRRGSKLTPMLIDFLRHEVPIRRPGEECTALSFTRDMLEMMVMIRDPQPAETIVEIVNGYGGQATRCEQTEALRALEKLTYCSFRKIVPFSGNYQESVEHPGAIPDKIGTYSFNNYGAFVRLYNEWLHGEGRDRSQWLAIAQKRARAALNGNNLAAIYCVAVFLHYPTHNRDDRPDHTLARLAELLDSMKREEGLDYPYSYAGQGIFPHIRNWTKLIAGYGPRARPYAKILIRIQEEIGIDEWSGFEQMSEVGGKEIMAYLFQCLPKINKEMSWIRADPKYAFGFNRNDPCLWWRESDRACKYAIDRWAGRAFANNEERLEWWHDNQDKSDEQWLENNLETTARMADAGDRAAIYIIRQIVPELPPDLHKTPVDLGDGLLRFFSTGSFRLEWLDKHRRQLKYDPNEGAFRIGQ